jgi:MFS family permease
LNAVTSSARTRRPLFALYTADAVSLTGNVMTLTAVPWFVLQTTGSASKTGLIAFFNFLPIVIASFLGGALVDRLGHRRMSIVSDVVSGVTVALIPLLHTTVGLSFPVLAGLVFLGGLLDSPGHGGRSAMLPTLAERAGWPMERAAGIVATVERGSRLAGAPLAGVLIAAAGPIAVLWIDAATFAFSAVVIATFVPADVRAPRDPASGYIAEIKEGLAFLRRERTVAALAKLVMVTNFLDAWTGVLLIVYAKVVYGSAVSLGAILGAGGAGSMIGAIAFAKTGNRLPRRALFAVCFMAVVVKYPALAVFPSQIVVIGAAFVAGIASGPLNPLLDTVMYERIPLGLRGRVLSALRGVSWMAMPLGVLTAGVALDRLSLRTNTIVIGGAYFAATASIWLSRSMREMERRPAIPSEPSAPTDARSPAVS